LNRDLNPSQLNTKHSTATSGKNLTVARNIDDDDDDDGNIFPGLQKIKSPLETSERLLLRTSAAHWKQLNVCYC
jgi:hypothetical protein